MNNIILIGNPESGKTNYLSAGLAYMAKKFPDTLCILGKDNPSRALIDKVEAKLKKKRWLDKTGGAAGMKGHYDFKVSKSTRLAKILGITNPTSRTWRDYDVHIDDWAGECFAKLNDNGKNNAREEFLQDGVNAGVVMIIFDGIQLKGQKVRSDLQDNLGNLLQHLSSVKIKRKIAVVVTKCDILEGDPVFCKDSKVSVGKVREYIEENFNQFKSAAHDFDTRYFCVSCVPVPEHKIVDVNAGTIPNDLWSLNDMESQVEAFKWILNNLRWG